MIKYRAEGVIEPFSHRDHGTAKIISSFVVGDYDDEATHSAIEHQRSCVDATSGVRSPGDAALN